NAAGKRRRQTPPANAAGKRRRFFYWSGPMLASLNPFSLIPRLPYRLEGGFRERSSWKGSCRKSKGAGLILGKVLVLVSIFFSESGMCQFRGPVIDGYGNCTWQDNGDSITISLDVRFKENKIPFRKMISRTVEMWSYDSDGNYHALGFLPLFPVTVQMDGNPATMAYANRYDVWGMNNNMVYGGAGGGWINADASTVHITATFSGSARQAASVLVGNLNWSNQSHRNRYLTNEQMGAAYLYPGVQGAGCPVVPPDNPPQPPKAPITLIMVAPDWDLGELALQHGEKRFTAINDQLCFSYSDPTVAGINLVIDADSQNGVAEGQYQLKNVDDSTQVVPYSLVLDDGRSEVILPNQGKAALRLNVSSPTCFSPTFKTLVNPRLKPGNYMDVLTFTAVTKT
ncbi:hypothetical protein, partial [Burkholderia plantarii]|uniref:hypothetical protein n=1 Tax=Burkholderia plantarii TaxID=41899 RepID=UPI001495D306